MKRLLSLLILLAVGIGVYMLYPRDSAPDPAENSAPAPKQAVEVIATDLQIPWDIAFLPDGALLVTERTGHLIAIDKDGLQREIPVAGVRQGGEGGLLGLVLHPQFADNHLLYLYLSSSQAGENVNRVERYRLEGDELADKKIIIDGIPGAIYHDGGRMEFGPDGKLYITTGDATRSQIAQDKNSLGGKILRLESDGKIPADNPFGTAVWSYGHRNPQGLAWDSAGNLWETEHGRSGALSGMDELNRIVKGGNFGWPTIEGDEEKEGMVTPVLNSGATKTWAPASLAYMHGKLYWGGLMGEALYEATLDGARVASMREYLTGEYGRIRAVRVGPDNLLYITTSNTDGRGTPSAGDDKIIRIDPSRL